MPTFYARSDPDGRRPDDSIACWHRYDPRFHGSFSLKKVLPVLVPSMSYDRLTVQDGQEAGWVYFEALRTNDAARRAEIRAAFLKLLRARHVGDAAAAGGSPAPCIANDATTKVQRA